MNSTARDFEHYHRTNPRIYDYLVNFAFQARNAGKTKTSITLLVNRVRWYVDVETQGDDFKINDHYGPYYARLLMAEYPGLEGLFNLRASEADDWIEYKKQEMAA